MKLVLAKYKEDISWAFRLLNDHRLTDVIVMNKDEASYKTGFDYDLKNDAGREATSYFRYIIENYDTLEGEYVLSQGRCEDQAPELPEKIFSDQRYFGYRYDCDANGFPNYPNLCLSAYCELFDLPPQEQYRFRCGSFFKVSAEEIRSKSLGWYQKAFQIASVEAVSSHCFERLWPIIYPKLQEYL